MSAADSSPRGIFLEYSEEAYGLAAHTAPDLVLWDSAFRAASPSSLTTKNKQLLIKEDLFFLDFLFFHDHFLHS